MKKEGKIVSKWQRFWNLKELTDKFKNKYYPIYLFISIIFCKEFLSKYKTGKKDLNMEEYLQLLKKLKWEILISETFIKYVFK